VRDPAGRLRQNADPRGERRIPGVEAIALIDPLPPVARRTVKRAYLVVSLCLVSIAVSCSHTDTDDLPDGASRSAGPGSRSVPASSPPFAVAGGVIAFSSDLGGNIDVWSIHTNGSDLRRLTDSSGADQSPTWSPDGRRVAFRSDRDGNDEVYVMDADGSHQRNLTRNQHSDYSPAWSPDGRWIAFASDRGTSTGGYANDIWLVRPDGTDAHRVTRQVGIDEYPVWSPDSTRVAFNCSSGRILPQGVADFEVCVVDAIGGPVRRLTDGAGASSVGGWAPDTTILFTSSRGDRPDSVSSSGDLFAINEDGSALRQITSGPALDTDPTWSPDWTVILFASDRGNQDGSTDLWVMRSDGTGVSRLWGRPGEEQEPVWASDRRT
jgi:Tol biopolymer transport system component